MQNVRAIAATALASVIAHGEAFTGDIDSPQTKRDSRNTMPELARQDLSFFRELCYGSLRYFFYLDALLRPFLKKPLTKKDADIHALLLIGLYQIIYLRTPDHASLSATVDACSALKKHWAKGLVNAILRNYLRQQADSDPNPASQLNDAAAANGHPGWLYKKLIADWPQQYRAILDYNNAAPPMTLRINLKQTGRDEYRQELVQTGIETYDSALGATDIRLTHAVDVGSLPHFEQGWVSVQDGGAQLAATLLDPQPGQHVLDACAAPGGKSVHLLQQEPGIYLTAIDSRADRLQRVTENLQRCQLAADNERITLIHADAADTSQWWNGKPFDQILLDAPCSGTGIISHHPDIKLLRRADDIAAFAVQQLRLLNRLWPILKEGGELLYCTCSVMPEENWQIIEQFLAATPSARHMSIRANWGVVMDKGRQLLPNRGKNGGFYYARLSKRGSV